MDICGHFVISLLVVHLPVILAESCNDGWEEYGDMCYYFSYNITTSRDDAQIRCIGKGGVLASVTNKDVDDYLHRQMGINSTRVGNQHHWIGLVGTNEPYNRGNWRWLDGNFVASDISWFPDEPTNEQTVCGKIGSDGKLDLALGNRECSSSILYICEATTDHTNQGWEEYRGHWYLFRDIGLNKNFVQAFNECLAMDASLASIETRGELTFIRNRTHKDKQYWIGLTTLHWLDHSPITYINFWDVNELTMNNPCVYLHTSINKWESDCTENKTFICQKAKPKTTTNTTVTTTSSTTTSTSTTTKQTTPSLTPSTSSTTPPEPPNNTVVSDTDDNVHMTSENRSPSNIVGNNGLTEKIQMDKDNTYIIVGVLVATLVVSGVIVTVTLLVRLRKLKTKEHVYYNNTAVLGNEANQGVNYINTQSGSTRMDHDRIQNTFYEDVDFEDGYGVTSTRQHAATLSTSDYIGASYQGLSFDTHASQNAQNIVTYQELTFE